MSINLYGIYNIFNAAGAMALTRAVHGRKAQRRQALIARAGAKITPAFGRGETLNMNGRPLQLSAGEEPERFPPAPSASASADDYATMITINDQYADGRDVSWLWDVDFDGLRGTGVADGLRACAPGTWRCAWSTTASKVDEVDENLGRCPQAVHRLQR